MISKPTDSAITDGQGTPRIGTISPRPVSRLQPPGAPRPTPMPATPQTLSPTPQAQAPTMPTLPQPSYGTVSPINPASDLRGQAITPGASPDRLQFAKEKFGQYASDLAPQIEAQRRGLLKNGAAMGRIGSGMLRTSFGDLASELNRQSLNEQNRLFTNAAEAAVGDQSNFRNELRGERGYQNELESQAFDRARQERLDQENLLNSGFQRDLQRANLGFGQNPAAFVGGVAENQQGRAGQATQSFVDLLGQLGNDSAAPQTPTTFLNLPQLPNVGQIPRGPFDEKPSKPYPGVPDIPYRL